MISVIIPVYNTEKFVGRCIESVIEQTYKDLEIIVIDDGSTDNSLAICQQYALQDGRIIILSQENQGASEARNHGIAHASGDYFLFVDSDDWIEPLMVEELYERMIALHTDVVISQIGHWKPYDSEIVLNSESALRHILRDRVWWGVYGKLFLSSIFQELRFPKSTISEDYCLMVHLMMKEVKICYTPQYYYHLVVRSDSLSRMSLCDRSYEQLDNMLAVCQTICEKKTDYMKYAKRNMADVLLKLSYMTAIQPNGYKRFPNQSKRVFSLIQSSYWDMMRNRTIPFTQKILLTGCISPLTARITAWLYSKI